MQKNKENNRKGLITYNQKGDYIDYKEIETYTKIQKRHFKKGEFFMTNKSLPKLLIQKNYTGLTFRLLFLLQTKLDFNNRISTFTQKDLAEELKTSQSNISRSLKILENDKIIIKKEHDFYFSQEYIKGAGNL